MLSAQPVRLMLIEMTLLAAMAAANTADYATTKAALSHGAHELNPFASAVLNHEPAAVGAKAALTLGELVLVHQLLKNPRTHKLGVAVAIICITVPAVAAVNNLRVH